MLSEVVDLQGTLGTLVGNIYTTQARLMTVPEINTWAAILPPTPSTTDPAKSERSSFAYRNRELETTKSPRSKGRVMAHSNDSVRIQLEESNLWPAQFWIWEGPQWGRI